MTQNSDSQLPGRAELESIIRRVQEARDRTATRRQVGFQEYNLNRDALSRDYQIQNAKKYLADWLRDAAYQGEMVCYLISIPRAAYRVSSVSPYEVRFEDLDTEYQEFVTYLEKQGLTVLWYFEDLDKSSCRLSLFADLVPDPSEDDD